MKQVIRVVFAVVFATTFGCSEPPRQELQIAIPADLNQEARNIVTQTWPKVRKACPGLDKYASSLQFEGIEENFSYAPENAQRVSIKFRIPDNDKQIPTRSAVPQGHFCFLEVSRDAKTLTVPKNACKEVFLDQSVAGTSYENGPLVISLQ